MVGSLLHETVPEWITQNDALDQDRCALLVGIERLDRIVDHALVELVQLAAKSVAEHLARQIAQDFILSLEQYLFQLHNSGKLLPRSQHSRRIDCLAVDLVAPATNGVEVLQSKTRRIDAFVTRSAFGARAVQFQ